MHVEVKGVKCFPVLRARLNNFVLFRAILRASAMNWVAFVMYVGKAPVAPNCLALPFGREWPITRPGVAVGGGTPGLDLGCVGELCSS